MISLMFSLTSTEAAVLLPCGQTWRKCVSLYKRGGVHHYDFTVFGRRYRGSTHKTDIAAARRFERDLIEKTEQGLEPKAIRNIPSLREAAERFLALVDANDLAPKTKKYYHNGWRLLEGQEISSMLVSHVSEDAISLLRFSGGNSNANNALRTLRRIFGKCVSWGYIPRVPKAKLKKETRRERLLDDTAEAKLMPFLRQPLKDIVVIMRDTGMRNISEVCRIRIEHIDWHNRAIFNPKGKTPEARRSVPMSDRVSDLLMTRCAGKTAGWVFPSDRSKTGHLTWINQQFARARAKAGLPKDLVMYCARHDFGTYALSQTGNLAAVMKAMGHRDVKTAMQYQHPELESVRIIINDRNARHNLRHKTEFLQ
jgi:integrase